jgi:hypothetical protein
MEVQKFEAASEKSQVRLKNMTKAQRTSEIVLLKKRIKRAERFYSPETKITVINVDTDKEKILSEREKQERLEEKLNEIYQKLDLLRWKDKRCRRCDQLKPRKEFAEDSIVCNRCQMIFAMPPQAKVCSECFKRFYTQNNHQMYCSDKCQYRAKNKE